MAGKIAKFLHELLFESPPTQIYYDSPFEFNTHWVSLDYPKNNAKTANIIRKLHNRDPIILKWSDTPFRDGDHIQVFTQSNKQIGWVPGPGIYRELEEAVKKRWTIEAHIKCTGKVQDPTKDIWWAVVEGTIKIPCAPGTEMVYMALRSNRYHTQKDCGKAEKQLVPLSVAIEYGRIPCPHCVKSSSSETKDT